MKKVAVAFAIIFALGLFSSIVSLSMPVSYAQESPNPTPEKPEKPDSD